MNPDSVDHVRQKAQQIAERLESDDSFRERLLADPDSVLREEGIFDQVTMANTVMEALCWTSCQHTSCADGTCQYTICPETCVGGVTLYRPPVVLRE